MSKLLVVDDEQSICWGITRLGESIGHEVLTASTAEEALEAVTHARPDVIVLDVRLPGMDGLTAMGRIREHVGDVPIIVMTAYGDLETAVQAVRNGAFEYIVKPFDLSKVEQAIARAIASDSQLGSPDVPAPAPHGMLGRSAAMQKVFKDIALAAASDAGVLLSGESGTGKELAARAIHQYSQRSGGPFVAVNVASLSPTLAESELFGHVRGAFTGAEADRTGLLVRADGGILFLDEVADIPLSTQVKLLRCLEHDEVTPVGSGQSTRTDFRVLSATHQDLTQRVQDGKFRHDLYFRLGAFRIEIPPLRDRPDDIRELAENFLAEASDRPSGPRAVLASETSEELSRRKWHGNVRELRNAVEHALLVARGGVIQPEHLPAPAWPAGTPSSGLPLDQQISGLVHRWAKAKLQSSTTDGDIYDQFLQLAEPALFRAALDHNRGQCAAASRQLGMHRTTLRKKLDEYAIE